MIIPIKLIRSQLCLRLKQNLQGEPNSAQIGILNNNFDNFYNRKDVLG